MILSQYGKRLVELYNEKYGTQHTTRTFFDEVFFPVIYGEVPVLNRYAHNSKFRYAKTPEEGLINFHDAISKKEFHTGTVFGFAAIDLEATTAGQVTSLDIPIVEDDAYASWIADALAIEVEGGVAILINHDIVLLWIQEGWQAYRNQIKQTPNPTAQQVRKWNAAYLAHKLKNTNLINELHYKEGTADIITINWAKLVLLLARKFSKQTIVCYIYGLDKSGNTTIGFIPAYLPQVAVIHKVYEEVFANNANLTSEALEKLVSYFRFKEVCERGFIGLYALEPEGIRDFVGNDKLPDPNKKYSNHFLIYQLWIIAMLEDKNLLEHAKKVAQTMNTFVQNATQKSNTNTRSQLVKDTLASGYKYKLVAQLTSLLEAEPSLYQELSHLIELTDKQTTEQLRLFLALVKFHYVGISKIEHSNSFNN